MTRPRLALALLFLGVALSAAIDGYHLARHEETPAPMNLALTFMLGASAFAWYYFDAARLPCKRSKLLDVAVIFFAPIAIPIHLVRSRPSGARLRAVGLFLAVFALLVVTAVATTTLSSYLMSLAHST